MRLALLLSAAFAAVGLAVPARAAGAAISGTYLINWSEVCSAQFGVQGSINPTGLLSGLNTVSDGAAEQGIGTISFTPSPTDARAGKYALTGWEGYGNLTVIQGIPDGSYNGSGIAPPAKVTMAGPFEIAADSLTLVDTTQNPAKTLAFTLVYGPASGPTTHAELLGGEPGCTFHATAWRQ